jgi:hypothetical protein
MKDALKALSSASDISGLEEVRAEVVIQPETLPEPASPSTIPHSVRLSCVSSYSKKDASWPPRPTSPEPAPYDMTPPSISDWCDTQYLGSGTFGDVVRAHERGRGVVKSIKYINKPSRSVMKPKRWTKFGVS